MSGWIKLHRSMTEWGWFTDVNTAHLFIYLLLKANHKDGHFKGVLVRRGQLVIGRKKLSENTGLTEQQVRTSLKRLKSTNEITINSTKRFSIVTILNYRKYQSEFELQQPSIQPSDQPTANQQLTNNQPATNHEQEGKKLRNTNIPPYNPPLSPSSGSDSSGVGSGLVFPTAPLSFQEQFPPPFEVPDQQDETPQPDKLDDDGNTKPKRTDSPAKSGSHWRAFRSCWDIYPKNKGREDAWCEWMRLLENGTLEQTFVIRDAIRRNIAEDYDWREVAYTPRMADWLRRKGWDDEPTPYPAQPSGEPRKTAHQLAWEQQEQDYFNMLSPEEKADFLKLKQEIQEAG